MYSLRLSAKNCISCGICMDVCAPRAIEMRISIECPVEGLSASYVHLGSRDNGELPPEEKMTFPYLAHPVLCDGCSICVGECPTSALELCAIGQWPREYRNYEGLS